MSSAFGAGTSYSILGTYNNGTPLTITGTSGDWTAVTINGVKGYVNSAYVSTTKTEGGNGGGSTPSASIGETDRCHGQAVHGRAVCLRRHEPVRL